MCDLLAGLPLGALQTLAEEVTRRRFRSGEIVCEAGSEGRSAYLVLSGRLRARSGSGEIVGEIGRGELVGEMSLITGESRSATVEAVRDTDTVELTASVFGQVLAENPACYQTVSRQLVNRLHRVLAPAPQGRRAVVLLVLHDGRVRSRAAIESFVEVMGDRGIVVDGGVGGTDDVRPDLAAMEASHDIVLIRAGPDGMTTKPWVAGQSDRTLLFVDAERSPVGMRHLAGNQPVELVLVHPDSVACPLGTRAWLDAVEALAHHHVNESGLIHFRRLDRRLRGCETVLVMGGGGARGLAHAGLFRALVEQGVEIDAVAGVSAGAVAAAVVAMGHDPRAGALVATQLFCLNGSPVDLTVPTVALASGRRMNARLKQLADETRVMEDLWLPATFVSANLTTAQAHVHRRGLLWRALRATTAIPGVFPPVPEPEGLLVDGGLVANLPVDLVRGLHPGATVITSDVGRKLELRSDAFPAEAEVSGWHAVRARVGQRQKVPGVVRILAQLTALGGGGSREERGDLHIDFDLARFGMFDFKKADAIIEAGYRQSLAALR